MRRMLLLVLTVLLVVVTMVANPAMAQEEKTGGCELKEGTPSGYCTVGTNEYLRCHFPREEGTDPLQGTYRSALLPGSPQESVKGRPTTYQCELTLTNGACGPPPDSNSNIDVGDVVCV
jgi:hypothetical protein